MAQRCVLRQPRSLLLSSQALFTQNVSSSFSYRSSRSFFGAASSPEPFKLHVSRTLPYGVKPLFGLISDVSGYPSFMPFCEEATIDSFSAPDAKTGRRWPARATLRVGVSAFSESYESRIYCVPYSVVEAISGPEATTSIPTGDLGHYAGMTTAQDPQPRTYVAGMVGVDLFTSLRARWTLKPVGVDESLDVEVSSSETHGKTIVDLTIEAHWNNRLAAAASNSLAPTIAEDFVKAFERKAKETLG